MATTFTRHKTTTAITQQWHPAITVTILCTDTIKYAQPLFFLNEISRPRCQLRPPISIPFLFNNFVPSPFL